jgi:TonB family protein
MQKPHDISSAFVRSAILLMTTFSFCLNGAAQQPAPQVAEERERGIELYQQGNVSAAIQSLRAALKLHQDDVSAWHYLGLAMMQQGKKGDARKAHEKAAKTAEKLLDSSFDLLATVPKTQLLDAADSADQYLALSSNPSRKRILEWKDRSEFLRLMAADDISDLKVYSSKDVTTKARIIAKQEPMYTEEARKNQITGTVVLKVVLAADGRVRVSHVVAGLPHGLTRSAVMAAHQIRFVPATRDGKPVSMVFQLEYNFNLY